MNSSSTVEALVYDSKEAGLAQSYPMKDTSLRPTHTLTPSQSSTVTCSSTVNLVEKPGRKGTSRPTTGWSCLRRKRKTKDAESNGGGLPMGGDEKEPEPLFMGWRLIFLGSWLNVLILLIPATWVLRIATPESHSLIFGACVVAMIPLVKMHDMSVRELAVRVGGTRTGLLNASMANIVEMVVAIIALRKCELRVVQSSLIGSMLSKLLLILGMCFFAGGMRFTQQDFDPTATQIHSSLLSLSVGAVLLPAAFHFTLSNRTPGESAQTSIEEQKQDILRMSHGVSVILIFIYISYLLFQFWSHSHHFTDAQAPSNKLPNAVSMRSMASRVRPPSPVLRRLMSPTPTLTNVLGKTPRSENPISPRPRFVYAMPPTSSPGGSILKPSPYPSQLAVNNASSTVRLVPEAERASPNSPVSDIDDPIKDTPQINAGPFQGLEGRSPGERASMVSELLSSYYADIELLEYAEQQEAKKEEPVERKPQLSWLLTLILLLVVTVLVALDAEWMIDSIDTLSPTISKEWIALILLPTVGSLAECITATSASAKDRLSLSISVAVGSTIQTALFVIPLMVLLGWVLDKPLALLFDPFESIVLYISVNTMGYVVADGKSNWLEGLILIGLYIVAAVTFWFYPGSNFSTNLAVCSTSKW
ncbi:sodium/calcium exchanger protein-domain-containing protein [Phanerochaete sordida]|uniref:Sodium/calcium exchanger protein-domain-containing protein n=1 Tax=Phanerochaete sordida TaxID=48140 RepID=A0A9P3LAP6_9APHY|nr:sodium/calcium exchanger protein-domain-containing protein [Phanerochaete sordida]